MCKEGLYVRLVQEGGCLLQGRGTVWNRGCNKKEGGEGKQKVLKKG